LTSIPGKVARQYGDILQKSIDMGHGQEMTISNFFVDSFFDNPHILFKAFLVPAVEALKLSGR